MTDGDLIVRLQEENQRLTERLRVAEELIEAIDAQQLHINTRDLRVFSAKRAAWEAAKR